jgi:hypothetical protein
MPRQNPRPAPNAGNASNNQAETVANETVADRARQMAERIRRLPDDLVASFALANSSDRVSRLQHIATEMSTGMLPVISWLERKRPADKAEMVKRRMHFVLQEVVQCAVLEIPEYAGGTVIMQTGGRPPSDGARRTAEMVVFVILFSATLLEWADDIEAEDEQRKSRQAQSPRSAKRGEGQEKIIAALTAHHQFEHGGCLNLDPIGVSALARKAGVGKATANRFFNVAFNDGEPGGYAKYQHACGDNEKLLHSLKLLRGEVTPSILFKTFRNANELEDTDD